jgi:hypothetical protein
LKFSWQQLQHELQVTAINRAIDAHRPARVLELAPGPARLSVRLHGIRSGVMVENSEEMIEIARCRLALYGLEAAWTVIRGDAFELDRLLPTEIFDFAYTFRFIRHFREPDRMRLYELLRDRLSARGLLMFDVVNATTRNAIEARIKTRSLDEIAIYDVSYTAEEFADEIRKNGFRVVSMEPVIARFALQSWLSYKLDDVIPRFASGAVRLLEKIPAQQPLEWVALCQKM